MAMTHTKDFTYPLSRSNKFIRTPVRRSLRTGEFQFKVFEGSFDNWRGIVDCTGYRVTRILLANHCLQNGWNNITRGHIGLKIKPGLDIRVVHALTDTIAHNCEGDMRWNMTNAVFSSITISDKLRA